MKKKDLKARIVKLESSLKLTDVMFMLLCKKLGMEESDWEEMYERGRDHCVSEELEAQIREQLKDLPVEVRSGIEGAMDAFAANGDLDSAKTEVDKAIAKTKGESNVRH